MTRTKLLTTRENLIFFEGSSLLPISCLNLNPINRVNFMCHYIRILRFIQIVHRTISYKKKQFNVNNHPRVV